MKTKTDEMNKNGEVKNGPRTLVLTEKNDIDLDPFSPNLYRRLGLDENASTEQIRTRWRRLRFLYHPDRCKSRDSQSVFASIKEAYRILGDEESRHLYDMTGVDFSNTDYIRDSAKKEIMRRWAAIIDTVVEDYTPNVLETVQMVRTIKSMFLDENQKHRDEIYQLRKNSKKITVLKKRVSSKEDASSLYSIVLQRKAESIEADLKKAHASIHFNSICLEVLTEYKDNPLDTDSLDTLMGMGRISITSFLS